jgi:hypothetical protein
MATDDNFLPLEGDGHRLVLGGDFLANADFTSLCLFGLDAEPLLTEFHPSFPVAQRLVATVGSEAATHGVTTLMLETIPLETILLEVVLLRMDVVGTELLEDALGLVIAMVRADSHDGPTTLELTFIVLGLVFGDAHPSECPKEATCGGTRGGAREQGSQGATGDRRTNGGQNSSHNAEAPKAADTKPSGGTNAGTGRCLRAFVSHVGPFREVPFVLRSDTNLLVGEAHLFEFANSTLRLRLVAKDAHSHILISRAIHNSSPYVCVLQAIGSELGALGTALPFPVGRRHALADPSLRDVDAVALDDEAIAVLLSR